MFKRVLSLIISLLLCQSFLVRVSAEENSVTVWVLDSDYNPVVGKIPVGARFYAAAQVDGAVDFTVYCAVADKDGICAVYSADDTADSGYAIAECVIPENVGNDYFIKIFVWENDTYTPLNNVTVFNASSPYDTHSPKTDMYVGRELLKDASFEKDNMIADGWDARNAARIKRIKTSALDGSFCAEISGRKAYYDSVKQDVTSALRESGKGEYYMEYHVLPKYTSSETAVKFYSPLVMYASDGQRVSAKLPKWNALYIYDAEGGVWNGKSACAVLDVPDELYRAEFYVETNSGTDDFLIDKCSLRKLITHQEYLKENEPIDYTSEGMKEYLDIIDAYKGLTASVYPQNSDKLIKNPYKGLNYYTTKVDFGTLDLSGNGAKCSNVVYHRLSWKTLEPEEGVYNFDVLEQNIEKLRENNMMLGIGIGSCITYNGYNSATNAQTTPPWLFEKYDLPYTKQIVGNGSVANSNVFTDEDGMQYVKVPVYNNEIFKQKMQNFLNAFAERFNDNPTIAYVDMRNYGNWGEWHFSSFNDVIKNHSYYDENGNLQTYTEQDFKNLVDMFENFRLPLAMFSANTNMLTYAFSKYGAGMRVDGTLSMNLADEHRKLAYADGKAFSVAEWFYQPEVYYEGGIFEEYGDYLPVFAEKVLREGKPSYISLGYWKPEDFYSRFSDLAQRLANKVGYWFKVSKITYPVALKNGVFAMTVKNDGSSQLYAGYGRNSGVKLALADSDGNILNTTVLSGVNPQEWKTGEYTYIAQNYSIAGAENASKLYLGIFSDISRENPDIRLGINADDVNGWYDLTTMESNRHLSDNKLYTASNPYADLGYGYREAYYAFDDNPATYWAAEIRKDEFLEIDFGEYVTAESVTFNAVDSVSSGCTLKGYDGKSWVAICENTLVTSGENTASFAPMRICKLRLVLNETSDEVLKISEMYVD